MKRHLRMRPRLCLTLAYATVLAFSFATGADAKPKAPEENTAATPVSLTKQAKINMEQAESIALKAVPGKVRRIELETDDGVLIYEIIICQGRIKKEVRVDANSGNVLEIDKKLGKCDD
ncbi:hypothetical protein GC174_07220 [bacterium]|nr:hypothetical protein [bacterium]